MAIVLSGMRPTGPLHLGHLVGALQSWLELQKDATCFFVIVDWHALAGEGYRRSQGLRDRVRQMAVEFAAVGIDPVKSALFVQSHVKEHAELHLLLSMITPTPWLLRNPAVKDQARDLGLIEEESELTKIDYGYLGYPVLQAADILLYQADVVPVGEDQLPHLELTREIVRRFNHLFGPVFQEPQGRLTETPRLLGVDGRKMSKSLDNAIYLDEEPKQVQKKVKKMITDPEKVRLGDPGHPDICSVFAYHRVWNQAEIVEIEEACRSGKLPCGTCKENLAAKLVALTAPIRQKKREIEAQPGLVEGWLEEGAARARAVASRTMDRAKAAVGM